MLASASKSVPPPVKRPPEAGKCSMSFASTSPPPAGATSCSIKRAAPAGAAVEPIVGVIAPGQMPVKYERVDRELVHTIFTQHVLQNQPVLDHILDGPIEKLAKYEILICGSSRCGWKGDKPFRTLLTEKLRSAGLTAEQVRTTQASCLCLQHGRGGPILAPWSGPTKSSIASPTKRIWTRSSVSTYSPATRFATCKCRANRGPQILELYGDVAFFNRQSRVALRHSGVIDPESIEEYFHYRGFQALAKVLEKNDPRWVVQEITKSNLRGRGGGGFPTARNGKWAAKPPTRCATSFATPTRATPAPSWTAACWKAIR